jgi:small conductance mechanosensitive channel
MDQFVQVPQIMTRVGELLVVYGLKVISAIIFLVAGYIVAKVMSAWIRRLLTRQLFDATLISFFSSVIYYAILLFAIVAALAQIGVETTSIIAVIGAAGLAIGLALRGTLANVAAGFFLILFQPFKAGHQIQAAGTSGSVEEVNLFTTKVRTADNIPVIIPNSKLISDIIINYSDTQTRRLEFVFPVSRDKDTRKIREVLNSVITNYDRILQEPAPFIGIRDLTTDSINFIVEVWVKSGDYRSVKSDFNEQVKDAFRKEGI